MDKLTIKAPSGKLVVIEGLDHSVDTFKTVKERLYQMGGFTPEEQSLNYEDLKMGMSGCFANIFDYNAPINFYKESHNLMDGQCVLLYLPHALCNTNTRTGTGNASSNPSTSNPSFVRNGDADDNHQVPRDLSWLPAPSLYWPENFTYSDCISPQEKAVYLCTCCNLIFFPGCDTTGHCFWWGNKTYDGLANGLCSCLSPSICCCCPCIITSCSRCCLNCQDMGRCIRPRHGWTGFCLGC